MAHGSELEPLLKGEHAAALLKIHPTMLPKVARRSEVVAIRSGGCGCVRATGLDRRAGNDRNGGAPNKL